MMTSLTSPLPQGAHPESHNGVYRVTNGQELKLNIGSGNTSYPGFLNLDKKSLENVDIVWDLENLPLPFEGDSVSEIICEHVLEHIRNFLPLMEDFYRICKPHARIQIKVPYFRYEGAFRDPTHVCFFTEHTFMYFEEDYEYSYYTTARFKIHKVELLTTSKSSVKNLHKKIVRFIPFKRFFNIFLWNIYSEIYYDIEVLK
jgi:SAM-dependent methyltransferase